ncbi:gamma-glutamyltransferase [Labrenzia sp. CP4]|jgi:gamma-glutamyltranspeptidase/glutathione hydrolase|uniref:gamma-glutamyltransferase n=1 Tax=Labrenzia sp. CP4 TaxID=1674922 RepID=UPI00078166FF|nr:gamma-glutamyltransferase [Labrenzia sp. CP4]AMN51495.1 gamma-glutamyltransferase [Labrenzia sp. CP4]MCR9283173.1 gamma-glutamyltransferase [Paracoccaceae bacterium]MEC9472665.1 gamma-glutamyltransferase [Pseudomonadota bacterium]MEE2868021.1 gamma-glutamyltransferase [Pseudomonadota bacterium]
MKHLLKSSFAAVSLATALVVGIAAPLAAQDSPIYSLKDRFQPETAQNGMVASQEAVASRVGVDILKKGGNAVDAAIATGFALAVTLPRAGNLGGGGFMMIHLADSGDTKALDYREMAPAAAFKDMFLGEDGEPDNQKSRFSGLAVGVPGTVAGFAEAFEKHGSGKLTWAELVAPAIDLAENGIEVTPDLAASLTASAKRLLQDPATAAIFYKTGGLPFVPGETLKQTDLAATLKLIADKGAAGFYTGEVAEKIAQKVTASGGGMTTEDLAGYKPVWRDPVVGSYHGYEIASMPPPSSGGVHIVQILNMLQGYPLAEYGPNSADSIHVMAETMRRAYADRSKYLGDPDFVDVPVKGLTDPAYAAELVKSIKMDVATPSEEVKPGDPFPYESNQTTHYSVVDKDGNAVSNTYTLNFSYGVGLTADGTGVLLNNELDDFSAKPGVPNAYGLIGGTANAVEGGKRPLSSMSPTLVFKDGKLFLATGSPGGSRIITTTLQIILNVVDHGMNIAEATAAPRIHNQWLPDEIRIEEGLSPDTIRLLEARGHKVEVKNAMGSTQSIMLVDGVLAGASDPRRPGALSAGY